jgi:Predicted membrane protein
MLDGTMTVYILSFLIGVIAGLRAMIAPAAASWAAQSGALDLSGSWLAFMGARFTPWIFSILAAGELITDQLPQTPSRKVPVQFGTRVLMGGLAGATIGTSAGSWIAGAVLGAIGATVGTLAGAKARAQLAARFGNDRPAALIEDAIAIVGAVLIVVATR